MYLPEITTLMWYNLVRPGLNGPGLTFNFVMLRMKDVHGRHEVCCVWIHMITLRDTLMFVYNVFRAGMYMLFQL